MGVAAAAEAVTTRQKVGLRRINLLLSLLHFSQGIIILLLGSGFRAPLTADYVGATSEFTYEPRLLLAAFLFLSAGGHLSLSLPRAFPWYIDNLRRRMNPERWWEYSLSASLMIVVIASLTGITDMVALVALFALTAAMNFFGLAMELHNRDRARIDWTPFVLGCVVGAVPWVMIVLYFARASPGPPAFVYGIVASLIFLYALFPLNMWLQYSGKGPWRSYIRGEYGYMFLSLVAKSLLAWQVFAGTLHSPALYP